MEFNLGAKQEELIAKAKAAEQAAQDAPSALLAGDLAALERLRAKGWLPRDREICGCAMKELSGESIRWMLDRYPQCSWRDAAFDPQARVSRENLSEWSARAMMQAQAFGVARGGFAPWAARCAQSRHFEAYFDLAQEIAPWSGPGGEGFPAFIAALEECRPPDVSMVKKLCAAAATELAKAAPAMRSAWREKAAKVAVDKMQGGIALSNMAELIQALPGEFTRCSAFATPGQAAHEKVSAKAFAEAASKTLKGFGPQSAPNVGWATLLWGKGINVEFAVERGWIDRIPAGGSIGGEDPAFVAWDCARLAREGGDAGRLAERKIRCAARLKSSLLDAAELEKLLEQLAGPGDEWEPGMRKTWSTLKKESANPLAVALASLDEMKAGSVGLRRRMETTCLALAVSGLEFQEAFGDPWLGAQALQAAKTSPAVWAQVESLELALESQEPAAVSKAPRL